VCGLLGVDLAAICELAANVEPYICAGATSLHPPMSPKEPLV
jgi:hypothetical protein